MADFYDVKTYDPRGSLGYLVTLVRRRLLDLVEPEFAALGLTPVQAIIVMGLDAGVADTAADLCKTMQHDPGAMTRVLDQLEERGLVRRVRLAGDRRAQKLELTATGRKALPAIKSAAVRASNRMLSGFSRSEAQQLIGYLKRLLEVT
ncbi:MAG TPA: MarR family winged helix-turn-helix transcriptional regulator [Burkholderiales bacterium]|nr:MarR family winged helix-turn-helix transcriptional regulator [Burkholderiales bacterium]